MKKLMFVSLCVAILSFGIVNQVQSSVIKQQQKMEMPAKKAPMVMYTCTMHQVILSDKPGKCPVCKMDLVKKDMTAKAMAKLVYTCSMHPIVKSAKPGKCPICKMDLVKK
jgi:membrane fusion protein, copper/silver efflux system